MIALGAIRDRVARTRPDLRVAVALSILLLLYGNGNSGFSHDFRDQYLIWFNLALMAGLLVWALGLARFSVADVGLDPRAAPRSALFGFVLSLLVVIPPVAFVAITSAFKDGSVEAPDITERSGAGMAYFLLFRQPIGTALFEEVAFRGVLYATWDRAGGARAAMVASSLTFSLWHGVITSRTVIESDVVSSPPLVAVGVLVSLAGLFVGGLIFAYLRWHTRSVAAPTVAHWLIVALMAVTVWSLA